jgi:hypothetical protein
MWGMGRPGRWREMDLLLIEALHEYEAGICKGCGQPLAQTTSEKTHPLDFGLGSVICAGCELLKSDAAKDPAPGELIYVKNEFGKN